MAPLDFLLARPTLWPDLRENLDSSPLHLHYPTVLSQEPMAFGQVELLLPPETLQGEKAEVADWLSTPERPCGLLRWRRSRHQWPLKLQFLQQSLQRWRQQMLSALPTVPILLPFLLLSLPFLQSFPSTYVHLADACMQDILEPGPSESHTLSALLDHKVCTEPIRHSGTFHILGIQRLRWAHNL